MSDQTEHPDLVWMLFLGSALFKLGHYEDAVTTLKYAVEVDPQSTVTHYRLGGVLQDLGRYDEALEEYKAVIKLDPNDAYAHNGLGDVYDAQGDYEQAMVEYQRAIEINPHDDYSFKRIGNVYYMLGKLDQAIVAQKRALELNPDDAFPHNRLGIIYQAQGKMQEALQEYTKAIELSPSRGLYRTGLISLLRKLNRTAEADEQIKIAHNLMENEAEYDRACFEAMTGNAKEALTFLKTALDKKQVSVEWIVRDPDLEPLRNHPRFKALTAW
jgi:tetratricopeptide (TPR) repeat protein